MIDTGGFEPDAASGIFKEMAKQTRQAVAEADVVIFVVDARDGISAQDHEIAKYLRRLGKPCVLAANKSEGMAAGAQLVEFFELGLGEVHAVSAAHRRPRQTGPFREWSICHHSRQKWTTLSGAGPLRLSSATDRAADPPEERSGVCDASPICC